MKAPLCSAFLSLLISHLALALVPVAHEQQEAFQPSLSSSMAAERRHLYGHNDAHYSGAPEKEQLFLIEEFDISPRPPLADHRLFSFLKGEIHGVSESELEQAVLNITTKSSKGGTWEGSKKFAEFPQIVVRQEQQYSKNLKPGMNEVIGDIVLPSIWLPTATYSFNMEAKLADGRTLFCFEFEYYLEGDL